MKVVGFNYLKKKTKKSKKVKIFCISNVFKSSMIIMGTLIFLMVFGIFNSGFSFELKECIHNFISSISGWPF